MFKDWIQETYGNEISERKWEEIEAEDEIYDYGTSTPSEITAAVDENVEIDEVVYSLLNQY